jgi:hypothetical protein
MSVDGPVAAGTISWLQPASYGSLIAVSLCWPAHFQVTLPCPNNSSRLGGSWAEAQWYAEVQQGAAVATLLRSGTELRWLSHVVYQFIHSQSLPPARLLSSCCTTPLLFKQLPRIIIPNALVHLALPSASPFMLPPQHPEHLD